MASHEMRALATRLARIERTVRGLRALPQLGRSTVEGGGGIFEYDENGNLVQIFGRQPDGTHGTVQYSGPPPPTPSAPIVEAAAQALTISWDSTFMGGEFAPLTFARVTAHAVPTDVTSWSPIEPVYLVGEFNSARGGQVTTYSPGGLEVSIYLVAWTQAGRFGEPSAAVVSAALPALDPAIMQELNDQLDQLEVDLNGLNTSLNGLSDDLASLDQAQQGLVEDLAGLDGDLGNLSTNLAGLDTALAGLEDELAGAQANITDLLAGQVNLEDALSGLADSQAALEVSLTGLEADLTGLSTAQATLATRLDGLDTALADLDAEQTTLAANLATTQTSVASAMTNVAALQTGQAGLTSNLANTAASVAAAVANVTTLQGQQSTLQGSLATLQTQQTGLAGNLANTANAVASAQAEVAALQTGQTNLTSNLAAVRTNVTSAMSNIASLQTSQSGLAANIATLTSTLSTLDADLDAIPTFRWMATAPVNGTTVGKVGDIIYVGTGGNLQGIYEATAANTWAARPLSEATLAASAVTAAKIAAGAVVAGKLSASAVTASSIAAGAIIANKIAASAVTASAVEAGAIVAGKIAASAVTATTIEASAVTAAKIAAGAIVADKIDASAVTAEKIAASAVVATKIAAGAIVANKIDASAVTAEKIAASAVVAGKIAASAVVADSIAASAVVAAKIAAGAIVANKIDASAVTAEKIAASAVTASSIAAGAIVANKIDASAVTAEKIAASAVVAGKIAASAVTATTIEASAITATKIAAGAVVAGKIDASAVTASTIAAGAVVAGKIAASAVVASTIAAGTITGDRLAVNAISAREIAASAVTADQIAANAITASAIAAGAITVGGIPGLAEELATARSLADEAIGALGTKGKTWFQPQAPRPSSGVRYAWTGAPGLSESVKLVQGVEVARNRLRNPIYSQDLTEWSSTGGASHSSLPGVGALVVVTGPVSSGSQVFQSAGSGRIAVVEGDVVTSRFTVTVPEDAPRAIPLRPRITGYRTGDLATDWSSGGITWVAPGETKTLTHTRTQPSGAFEVVVSWLGDASQPLDAGDKVITHDGWTVQINPSDDTLMFSGDTPGELGADLWVDTSAGLNAPHRWDPRAPFKERFDTRLHSLSTGDTSKFYHETSGGRDGGGRLTTADGTTYLTATSPQVYARADSPRAEAWVRLEHQGTVMAGVVLLDTGGGYRILLDARRGTGATAPLQIRKGNSGALASASLAESAAIAGQWYRVVGWVSGDTVHGEVYSEAGTLLGTTSAVDTEYTSGRSGVYAYNRTSFDEVVLTPTLQMGEWVPIQDATIQAAANAAATAQTAAADAYERWAPTGVTTIDGGKITADSITATQMKASSITALQIAAGAIVANKIDASAVTAEKIAASAVVAGKIAASAVVADSIAASAVVATKIAASAVVANKIAASAVVADKIAASAVVAGKIAASAVTANEIAALSISADHIQTSAITADKIQAGAITIGIVPGLATNLSSTASLAAAANSTAASGFAKANTAHNAANTANSTAVAANALAATANTTATSGFAKANTAHNTANTANTTATSAFAKANTAHTAANTAATAAANAAAEANGAFERWAPRGYTTIHGGKITTGTITADHVDASIITAGEIYSNEGYFGAISADQIAAGSLDASIAVIGGGLTVGSRVVDGAEEPVVSIDSGGISVTHDTGGSTRFPSDGSPASIEGIVTATAMTVGDNLTIRGSGSLQGTLDLASGITAPPVQPSVFEVVENTPVVAIGGDANTWLDSFRGLIDWDADHYMTTVSVWGGGLRRIGKNPEHGFGGEAEVPSGQTWNKETNLHGLCKVGTDVYVVRVKWSDANWYLSRIKGTTPNQWTLTSEINIGIPFASTGTIPTIVEMGGTIGLIWHAANGLWLRRYHPTTLARIGLDRQLSVNSNISKLRDAHYGPHGGAAGNQNRLYVSTTAGTTVLAFTPSAAPTLTNDPTWTPTTADNFSAAAAVMGLTFDNRVELNVNTSTGTHNTGNQFVSMSTTRMYRYGRNPHAQTIRSSYAWYDGVGTTTRRTPASPETVFARPARRAFRIETPPAPDVNNTDPSNVDKADRILIYAAVGADPRLQATLAKGVRNWTSRAAALSTATALPVTTNEFIGAPNASSGQIRSSNGVIELNGAGDGRVGPFRWNNLGSLIEGGTRVFSGGKNANHSTANGAYTPLTWPLINRRDTDTFTISGANITVWKAGIYLVIASVEWAPNASGNRYFRFLRNGGINKRVGPAQGSGVLQLAASNLMVCSPGDVIAIDAYHNAGVNLNVAGDNNKGTSLDILYLGL